MCLILNLERESVTERKAIRLRKENVIYHIWDIINQMHVLLAPSLLSFLN